jgi:hypothetical protein
VLLFVDLELQCSQVAWNLDNSCGQADLIKPSHTIPETAVDKVYIHIETLPLRSFMHMCVYYYITHVQTVLHVQ